MLSLPQRVLLSFLAVASFCAVAACVRSVLPPPVDFAAGDKLTYLREHPDRYSALIVGSSAMFRGFDPTVIDPIVQAAVPGFESFNLGARGMRGYESDAVLREALDICGDSIRWVLVEAQSWTPLVDKLAVDTARDKDWHDLLHTRMVLDTLRDPYYPEDERSRWSWYHKTRFLHRVTNFGDGRRLSIALGLVPSQPYVSRAQLERSHGYVSIEESLGEAWAPLNEEFLADVAAFEKDVAVLIDVPRRDLAERAVVRHLEQAEFLRSSGVTVVHVMPPFARGGLFVRYLDEQGHTPLLLDFLDPARYPELYEVDARLDLQHLKAEGAAELSRLAGERLAEMLRREAREEDHRSDADGGGGQ